MDMTLITNRRREVEQEIGRLRSRMAEMETELAELDTVIRVVSRLGGAERAKFGPADEPQSARASGAAEKAGVTMPEMILGILHSSRGDSPAEYWLEPKEIARRIEQVYGVEPRGEGVSSIVWRMWKRGQLLKDADTPRYGLPDNEKPADEVSRQDASAGLFSNVHGREAVEGGGT